jgi:pSer/pThr/pTyr-binding forkhead associated (FHA) protein
MGEAAKQLGGAGYWLVDVASGKAFPLRDGFKVGRGKEGDLQILDTAISTVHCVFHVSGPSVEIEDMGSRNGTIVGGKKLEPGLRLTLLPGVRIEIGNRTLEIQFGDEPKARSTAVELASLGSQLEPDNIPAPSPSAWSGAAVPKGTGQPLDHAPKAAVRPIGDPIQLRDGAGRRSTATTTKTMPIPKTREEPKNWAAPVVFALLMTAGAIAWWLRYGPK